MLPVTLDYPKKLATLGTQDRTKGRENRRGNQEWTIQRNWQHWVPKISLTFLQWLVYPMLPVSLDCPFLIASSGFSNLWKTEEAIKNGQSKETGNIGYTRQDKG
jgi:hypothetical protein